MPCFGEGRISQHCVVAVLMFEGTIAAVALWKVTRALARCCCKTESVKKILTLEKYFMIKIMSLGSNFQSEQYCECIQRGD